MKCEEAHGLLGTSIPPNMETVFQQHLSECEECRTLRDTLALLDMAPAPEVRVDVAGIHQQLAERERRRARRWRRAALLTAGALAASLVLFLLTRIEIRWEDHQLTVRWGTTPPPKLIVPPPPPVEDHSHMERQLAEVSELLHSMLEAKHIADMERRHELMQLQARLEELQTDLRNHRAKTARDVNALYEALFTVKKGNVP